MKAGSELVQTQSSAVSSTSERRAAQELPLIVAQRALRRGAAPGVATTGGPRGAVINGLPNNTVNVTIDGISTGNMLQSTDGFFSMVTPRMDAVEEVTVTGAVPGSGSGSGLGSDRVRHPLGQRTTSTAASTTTGGSRSSTRTTTSTRSTTSRRTKSSCTSSAAARRSDRASRPLRRPRQGVLLLQLRAAVSAERERLAPGR